MARGGVWRTTVAWIVGGVGSIGFVAPTPMADAAPVTPCSVDWARGAGTFTDATWDDPSSWSTGRVPGLVDVACFPAARVEFFGLTTAVGAVHVDSAGTLYLWGSTLDLDLPSSIAGITLANGSLVRGKDDLTIERDRSAGSDAGNSGRVGTSASSSLIVDGELTVGTLGGLSLELDTTVRGTVRLSANLSVGAGRKLVNEGLIENAGRGSLQSHTTASLANSSTGTIDLGDGFTSGGPDAAIMIFGSIDNEGQVVLDRGDAAVRGTVSGSGTWEIGTTPTSPCTLPAARQTDEARLYLLGAASLTGGSLAGPGCLEVRGTTTISATTELTPALVSIFGPEMTVNGDRVLPPIRQSNGGKLIVNGTVTAPGGIGALSASQFIRYGGTGTLTVPPGDRLTFDGTSFSVEDSLDIVFDRPVQHLGATVSVQGTATLTSNDQWDVVGNGTITSGTDARIINTGFLTFDPGPGKSLFLGGSGIDNIGTIQARPGFIDMRAPLRQMVGTSLTGGTIEVFGGTTWIFWPVLTELGGTIRLHADANIIDSFTGTNSALRDLSTITGSGALELTGGASLDLRAGAATTLANNGLLSLDAGSVLSTTGFRQSFNATYRTQVGATSAGRIATDSAELGGRLLVSPQDPNQPPLTDVVVLDATTLTGVFAVVESVDGGAVTADQSGPVTVTYDAANPLRVVTNTANSGEGSLRQTMLDANAAAGLDTITFAIPGTGPFTIVPSTALPELTGPTIIDGTTQPGYDGTRPLIELDGNSRSAFGLTFRGAGSELRALSVTRWRSGGVRFAAGDAVIEGNWIGVSPDGVAKGNTNFGLFGNGSNTIVQANVIADTRFGDGIQWAEARDVVIRQNRIGSTPDGSGLMGNQGNGIQFNPLVDGHYTVGGPKADDGNLILGNTQAAVLVRPVGSGTAPQATVDIRNNTLGAPGRGNGAAGAATVDILLADGTVTGNVITDNPLRDGVLLRGPSGNVTIRDNTIARNGGLGINLSADPNVPDAVTANDAADTDNGINGIQNTPTLALVTLDPGATQVGGTLSSTANTTFTIDVYANSSCDPSGSGEAEGWLGTTTLTTDSSGVGSFATTLPATTATILTATATGPDGTSEISPCRAAIRNDITFTADDASATEGDGTAVIDIRASDPVPVDTVVFLALADGSAVLGADYVVRDDRVTIPAGATRAPATVQLIDDGVFETPETFEVLVIGTDGVSIVDRGTVTVDDNDPLPRVTVQPFNPYLEDAGIISLPVRLSRTAGSAVTLEIDAVSGTAETAEDFRLLDPTVTIPAGATEALARVEILQDDEAYEADREFFAVTASYAGQFVAVGDVEIQDDDPYVQARFVRQPDDDPNRPLRRFHVEGTTQDTTILLPVELTGASPTETVTVELVIDSTDAVRGVDFDVSPSTLVFEPGVRTRTFVVRVHADSDVELDEHLELGLATPQGELLGRADDAGRITIVDDDDGLVLTPALAAALPEGAESRLLTVTADVAPLAPLTIPITYEAVTADPTVDLQVRPSSITIPAGATAASVAIVPTDDGVAEGDESLRVVLGTPSQGWLTTRTLDLTIVDDDPPSVTIAGAMVPEAGGPAELTVTIPAPLPADVVIPYTFVPRSSVPFPATPDADYDARQGGVVIPAGETTATLTVPIVADTVHEADEVFVVVLFLGDGSTARAAITITDDDPAPSVTLQAFGPYREDAGTVSLVARLERSAGVPLTFDVRAIPGTAEAPEDYELLTTTITIPAGATEGPPIRLRIIDDTESYEANREFLAVLLSQGATDLAGDDIEIINDDVGPQARFVRQPDDPRVGELRRLLVEGSTSNPTLTLQVELLGDPITEPTTVEVVADSLVAVRGVDYDISPTLLTFQPGDGPKTVVLTSLADTRVELDEDVFIGLQTEFGGLLGRVDDAARITILDDDGEVVTDPVVDSFRTGWDALADALADWLSQFDLPAASAPAIVTPSLASHFGLPDLAGDLGLPTIDPTLDTLPQLVADLTSKGFAIDFVDSPGLGHPGPSSLGDLLQARIDVALPDLARVAGFGLDPFNDATAGILASLATSLGLDAVAGEGWLGDLRVDLVIGVDATGFYVEDGTTLSLGVAGAVDLLGSGTVGGLPALPEGLAVPDLTVELRPALPRLRNLTLDLLPSLAGSAELTLDVEAGPFALVWDGSWSMGPGGVTVEPPTISGNLRLPGLDTCDPIAPADLTVAGELLADRWRVTANGPVSQCYLFGGFEAGEVAVAAEIGPQVLEGAGTLTLRAPVPGGERQLEVGLAFDDDSLTATGSLSEPVLDLGEVSLDDPTISASFSAGLPGGPLGGSVSVAAASADVLDGVGSATQLEGTLDSDGLLGLRAASLALSIGGAIDLTLTDVSMSFGPGSDANLLEVASAVGTFPALDDLEVTFTDLFLTRSGRFGAAGIAVDSRGIAESIGLGGILPFDVTEVTVVFPTPSDLSVFEVSVVGGFDFTGWPSDAGFTPRIRLGDDVVTPATPPDQNRFTFSVAVDALDVGEIRPLDLGPITVGFDGLRAGEHTIAAELSLEGYAGGVLQTGASGSVSVDGPAGSALTGVGGTVDGDLVPGDPVLLDLAATATVSGTIPPGLEVTDLQIAAGIRVQYGAAGFSLQPRLEGLTAAEVSFPFGDVITVRVEGASIDFAPGPDEDALTIPADGNAEVIFGDEFPVLAGWGGSARGIALDGQLQPRLLPGFGIDLTVPSGEQLGLPAFIPLRLDEVGVTFPALADENGDLAVPPDGLTLTPDTLSGLRLRVSGGLEANDTWPIAAGVGGLEVDLGNLANGRQPVITNLDEIFFGVEPFDLPGGVTIGGGLRLGTIDVGGTNVWYGRVFGDFAVSDIGGGADLVVTEYGPVLMKVRAPLGIPLGPTGLVLSGAEGAASFGDVGIDVPPAGDPLALLTNGFDLPTDLVINDATLRDAIGPSVADRTYTWNRGFAIALAGDVTSIAAPGLVSGRASVGFNLGFPEGDNDPPGLQLVGKGELTAYGVPLGEAGLLVDFADPVQPTIDLAYASPVPGSPLALVLPATATFGAQLRTDGVVLGTVAGLRTFAVALADGIALQGGALFDAAVDELAARLDRERERPLAVLLLDIDGNGTVSSGEAARTITGSFVLDRVLGRNGLAPLLPSVVTPPGEQQAAAAATAVLNELLLSAGQVLDDPATFGSFGIDGVAAMSALADTIRNATSAALDSFGERFDPSLAIEGNLQPSILGIPFGDPTLRGTLFLDRRGLFFELGGSVIDATKLTLSQTFPPAGAAIFSLITLSTLGLTDQLSVGVRLPFGGMLDTLLGGQPLPQFEPLDPDWAVTVEGALNVFGYETAELSGLAVLPGQATFLQTRVQVYDDPADWTDRNRIPVTQERFDALVRFGGILVTGSLLVPQLVTRPGELLGSLPPPPADPLDYAAWLADIAELGRTVDTPARVQLFLPGVLGITDEASAIAAAESVAFEGVWNGKLLGLDLGAARLELTGSGASVTGALPLSGGTVTATLNTRGLDAVAARCSLAPDPTDCLPTAGIDVSLTNAEVVRTLSTFGVPTSLIPQSTGRLRAFTPGFDPDAGDPLRRNGGIEVAASLSAPGLFGTVGFTFAATPRPGGFDVVGTGLARRVGPIAGVTIDNATITVAVVDGVPSIRVQGEASVLGALASVDGVLGGDLTGSLTMQFAAPSPAMTLGGGLSVRGVAVLTTRRDSGGQLTGSLAVLGQATLPSWLATAAGTSTVSAGACVDTAGNVEARLALPTLSVGPKRLVRIGRNAAQVALPPGPAACTLPAGTPAQTGTGPLLGFRVANRVASVALDGTLEFLADDAAIAGLTVRGSLDGANGTGSLAVAFSGGNIDLGGFRVNGSATLSLTTTSLSLAVTGNLSVPGLLDRATVSGTGDEGGVERLAVTATGFTLPVVTIDQATLELQRQPGGTYRLGATVQVDVPGVGNNLSTQGSFTSNGNGSLTLSATSVSIRSAQITNGTFSLVKTGSTMALRASGRFTLFGQGLDVVQADLTLTATTITGSLVIRPANGAPLVLGGWSIGGTLRLAFSGTTVTIEIDDGTVTIPGWGAVSMDGSLSVPPVNGAAFTVATPAGGLRLGGVGSPFFGTGTFRLAFSNNVGTLSVQNGGLAWRDGSTTLASATVPSLSIATNGSVSASLSGFSASAGSFAFTVPSLSFLVDPEGLNARLSLGAGSVTIPGIATLATPAFTLGTSPTFTVVLAAGQVDLGLLSITGRLTFQRQDGVFRLRFDDVRNGVGIAIAPPRVSLDGLVTIPLPTFFVASDGTFAVNGNVPSFGPDGFQVIGASMSLSKSGAALSTLAGSLNGGQLLIGNAEPVVLPALEFSASSRFDETFTLPSLEFGPFLRTGSVDLRFRHSSDGTTRLTVTNTPSVTALAGTTTLTLNGLDARSDGTFTGSVTGRLTLFGIRMVSATFDLQRDGSVFRLNLPASRRAEFDLGFLKFGLSGFARSTGSFEFTGSATLTPFGVPGFSIQGSVALTVSSAGGIEGSYSGQVCFIGCAQTSGSMRSDGRISGLLQIDLNGDGDFRDAAEVNIAWRFYLQTLSVRVDADRDGQYDDFAVGDDLTSGDTTDPFMSTPPNITVNANIGPAGRVRVYYSLPVASDGSQPLTVRCTPTSGSEFAVGATTVTCRATDDGGNTTERTFTVNVVANAAAIVPTATNGATVVVTASGFAPNSYVYVRFQSETVPVGIFQADANGVVVLTLTVPEGLLPGPHNIIVEGFAPDGSVRQFVQPFVITEATLPRTGGEPWTWLSSSVAVLLAGLVALLVARRRTAAS